jgi:UDP-N-acetylmuramate--alanine ligase
VRAAFRQFVENVPFYGFGVMCLDHPEVQALVGRIEDRKIITYGENPQADVRFMNLDRIDGQRSIFDVEIRRRRTGQVIKLDNLVMPMPGRHNISNATAAIAVANRLGMSSEDIRGGWPASAASSAASR